MLRIGLIVAAIGAVLGLIGDYPINSPAYLSFELAVVGGLMLALGTVFVLWASGKRGGRGDEPPGYIRP